MLARVFDERFAPLRLALLAASGAGFLTLLRDPEDRMTTADWTLAVVALLLCAVCVWWPTAGALAMTADLGLTDLVGWSEPVVPQVGASWAILELAMRAPGRRLAVAAA